MSFTSALVTGASGFLGRALVAELVKQGKYVIVAGRPGPSVLPEADHSIRISEPNSESFIAQLGKRRIDIVFHCAGYGVSPTQRDPSQMFRANVRGAGDWVDAAANAGARALVYAGSCSEYGTAAVNLPLREEAPLAAQDLYGASKAAGGLWGRSVARQHGIAFQWLRIFGVFGEGEASYRLLPYLVTKLRAGERVDLTPGEQLRDMLYVHDAVRGMILAGEAALGGKTGPFNLCSGQSIAVRTFAEMVAETVGHGALRLLDFGGRPYRADEQLWMVGDPAKFNHATGFRPEFDIRGGILQAVCAIQQKDWSKKAKLKKP